MQQVTFLGVKNDIYLPQTATVENVKMLNGTEMFLRIRLDSGQPLVYEPGQFVEISLAGLGESPISIASSPTQTNGFELVVRNTGGNVTRAIHKLHGGDKVGIRGPYGKGYPYREMQGRNIVFICGGIGLVPQRSFIRYIFDNRDKYGQVNVLFGTKCHNQRLFQSELELWKTHGRMNVLETIDIAEDCWNGNVGVVSTLIPKVEKAVAKSEIFVCGPPIMYKFVLSELHDLRVKDDRIYVNLERRMKCGVGKCGHCQINNFYVCKDGPVFKWYDLAIAGEALS
jgi:NAD(P)H-flavin reductase